MLCCLGPGVERFLIVVQCLRVVLRGQNGHFCILHHQKAHSGLMLPAPFLWIQAVVISERVEMADVISGNEKVFSLWRDDIWDNALLRISARFIQVIKTVYQKKKNLLMKTWEILCPFLNISTWLNPGKKTTEDTSLCSGPTQNIHEEEAEGNVGKRLKEIHCRTHQRREHLRKLSVVTVSALANNTNPQTYIKASMEVCMCVSSRV